MGILEGLTPRQPSAPLAEFATTGPIERFSAGFSRQTILTNAFNQRRRIREDILSDQSEQAFGDPDVWRSKGDRRRAGPRGIVDSQQPFRFAIDRYFISIRKAAEMEPGKFGPIAKSRDELERMVTADQKRQLEEIDRILGNASAGAFAAETLGGIARAATDEGGLSAGILGLGIGSVARMGFLTLLATEAALGAGAEAAILAETAKQAERLGVEAPDPTTQILLGAAGGMLFPVAAGVLRSGVRAAVRSRGVLDRLSQARAERASTAGLDEATHDAGVAAAGRAVEREDANALSDMTDRAPDSAFLPRRDGDGLDTMGADFERIVDAVIQRESGGDPNAVSKKGARGLMQIMEDTARAPGFGVPPVNPERLFDPALNRLFGSNYLRALLRRYGGDLEAALIANNAGFTRADKWLKAGRDYSALSPAVRAEAEPYAKAIMKNLGVGPEDAGIGFNAAPRRFRIDELETDAARYQFKDSLDATGRTGALGDAKYNEGLAGLLLVHERLDGRRIIANGHERFALARAAGPEARVNAIVLREADGWTEGAVLARSGILDFLEGRGDPARLTAALRRRAVLDEALTRKPDLFQRLAAAEERLHKIEGGFDAARLRRFSDRVDKAKTNKQREKAARQLETQAETVQELNRARSDRARLSAERNRLLGQVDRDLPRQPTGVRPRHARQAIRAQEDVSPEAAAIFAAAPERGIRATVKDIAAHVRGRVQPSVGRRAGDDAGRPRPPAEARVPEVTTERIGEFAEPDSPARTDAADEALREVETQIGDGEGIAIVFDFDGKPMLTDRQLIADLRDDKDFLAALDLCKTGKA